MTQQRVLHPEWRPYHEGTTYPFADHVTLRNDDGDFIPESTFFDASLYPVGGQVGLYLSRVTIREQSIEFAVGDRLDPERCTGAIDLTATPDDILLVDAYGRPAGVLFSANAKLGVFQTWSLGAHAFDVTQTGFCDNVCWPIPDVGFRGFLLDDGSVMTGDIWLIGDDGIVLTPGSAETGRSGCSSDDASPASVTTIRVDVVGDPLFRRRLCGDAFNAPRFIRGLRIQKDCDTIDATPNAYGNFNMTAGSNLAAKTVLRVRSYEPHSLTFEAVGEPQNTITKQ